jgi:hydroxymethylbilane synthase
MRPLRLATRGSALALWQARHVQSLLACEAELVVVETSGDLQQRAPLAAIGGQGLFTKEIQRAVLEGRADLAVHSLKDLPTEPTPGLTLAAVPERGPVADVFVSTKWKSLEELPAGARVATGSPRRRAMLRHRRPDLRFEELRGNLDTRLRKLLEQGLDAIILAEAGLVRLGQADQITERLAPAWMVPAVGQGALGVEVRSEDVDVLAAVAKLDHAPTRCAVSAERAFLRTLSGGCSLPVGALATAAAGQLRLVAALLDEKGTWRLDDVIAGPEVDAELVGVELARRFLAAGRK